MTWLIVIAIAFLLLVAIAAIQKRPRGTSDALPLSADAAF